MVSVVDSIQRFLMVSVVGFFVVVAGNCFLMVSVAGFLLDSAAAGGSNILERIERFLVFCAFRIGFHRWFLWFPLRFFNCFGYICFIDSVIVFLVDSAAAGGSNILERIEQCLVFFVFLGLVSVVGFLWFPLRFFMTSVTLFMVSITFLMVSVAGFLLDSAAAGGSNILERIERFLVFCAFRIGFHRWFLWFPLRFFNCFGYICFIDSVIVFLVDSAAAGGS